jgi:hypothetical protein
MIETNLVDFRSLALDPSPERKNELLKGVSSLFAFTSERCTLEQIEIYDDVIGRLADMVEIEARIYAAEKISGLRRAPERTIRKFAADDVLEVASPVLRKSPVLNDHDLIAVAEKKGNGHLMAIAQRSVLSERVTDIVVGRGDDAVRLMIAGNHGARLGEWALAQIVQQALSDAKTAEALGKRPDTPDTVIAQVIGKAVDNVRAAFTSQETAVIEDSLIEAARLAEARMSNSYWLGLYDFETAWEKILQQGGRRIASESLLNQYAIEDRFADVVATFALLADLDIEEAKHWLVRLDTEPFVVMARALGLKFVTVQSMLKAGPWKHRLDNDQRLAALSQFQQIEPRVARARIAASRGVRLAI